MTDTSYRDRLIAFYSRYNPSCVNSVEAILATYRGREDDLIRALVEKYGPENLPPSSSTAVRSASAASTTTATTTTTVTTPTSRGPLPSSNFPTVGAGSSWKSASGVHAPGASAFNETAASSLLQTSGSHFLSPVLSERGGGERKSEFGDSDSEKGHSNPNLVTQQQQQQREGGGAASLTSNSNPPLFHTRPQQQQQQQRQLPIGSNRPSSSSSSLTGTTTILERLAAEYDTPVGKRSLSSAAAADPSTATAEPRTSASPPQQQPLPSHRSSLDAAIRDRVESFLQSSRQYPQRPPPTTYTTTTTTTSSTTGSQQEGTSSRAAPLPNPSKPNNSSSILPHLLQKYGFHDSLLDRYNRSNSNEPQPSREEGRTSSSSPPSAAAAHPSQQLYNNTHSEGLRPSAAPSVSSMQTSTTSYPVGDGVLNNNARPVDHNVDLHPAHPSNSNGGNGKDGGESWFLRFHRMFGLYCPEKLVELPEKLDRHRGGYAEWMQHLVEKYGPEPNEGNGGRRRTAAAAATTTTTTTAASSRRGGAQDEHSDEHFEALQLNQQRSSVSQGRGTSTAADSVAGSSASHSRPAKGYYQLHMSHAAQQHVDPSEPPNHTQKKNHPYTTASAGKHTIRSPSPPLSVRAPSRSTSRSTQPPLLSTTEASVGAKGVLSTTATSGGGGEGDPKNGRGSDENNNAHKDESEFFLQQKLQQHHERQQRDDLHEIVAKLTQALEVKAKELVAMKQEKSSLAEKLAHSEKSYQELKESSLGAQTKQSEKLKREQARANQLEGQLRRTTADAERLSRQVALKEHQSRIHRSEKQDLMAELALKEQHIAELTETIQVHLAEQKVLLDRVSGLRLAALSTNSSSEAFQSMVVDLQKEYRAYFDQRRQALEREMQHFMEAADLDAQQKENTIRALTEQLANISGELLMAAGGPQQSNGTGSFFPFHGDHHGHISLYHPRSEHEEDNPTTGNEEVGKHEKEEDHPSWRRAGDGPAFSSPVPSSSIHHTSSGHVVVGRGGGGALATPPPPPSSREAMLAEHVSRLELQVAVQREELHALQQTHHSSSASKRRLPIIHSNSNATLSPRDSPPGVTNNPVAYRPTRIIGHHHHPHNEANPTSINQRFSAIDNNEEVEELRAQLSVSRELLKEAEQEAAAAKAALQHELGRQVDEVRDVQDRLGEYETQKELLHKTLQLIHQGGDPTMVSSSQARSALPPPPEPPRSRDVATVAPKLTAASLWNRVHSEP